jgi:hypothetical protein
MASYRKTNRRRPRKVKPSRVRLAGSPRRVDLRRLPWWCDPLVMRIIGGRK